MRERYDWLAFRRMTVLWAAVLIIGAVPIISRAMMPTASLRIVNNSNRTIRNLYLAHAGADDWGNDQLGDASIAADQSYAISGFSWDQQQVKVIAEDQDGCFLTTVVAVTDNAVWTITNDTPVDCGGGR
jgi:hypothetical protein